MTDYITGRFRRAFDLVIGLEGGYTDHPLDKGGPTKYGISWRSYSGRDIAALTLDDAQVIYYADYWKPLRCDEFADERIAHALFLFGVNAGIRTAAKALQAALNGLGRPLVADGSIGPATLAAANAVEGSKLLAAFYREAERHYRAIVERDSTQAAFLTGWLARLEAVA